MTSWMSAALCTAERALTMPSRSAEEAADVVLVVPTKPAAGPGFCSTPPNSSSKQVSTPPPTDRVHGQYGTEPGGRAHSRTVGPVNNSAVGRKTAMQYGENVLSGADKTSCR